MTLVLVETAIALIGWLIFRYGKHPACSLGVIPFIIGMVVTSASIDKAFEHDRYIVLGYLMALLVAFVGIMLFNGRHKYRARLRGCSTCADPLQTGLGTGVKDLKATPCIGVEDTGYDMGWDGETVMMSRGRYRCSSCGREFYGKTGYNPFSARLK